MTKLTRSEPSRTTCKLCLGPGPLTDEDITPTWVRKHVKSNYIEAERTQLPPRHKMRICRTCNGNLGAMFDNRSAHLIRRLIDGETLTLDTVEQSQVAGWAAKFVMMTCFGDSRPGDWGHDLARKIIVGMMTDGEPPINTSIRVGKFDFQNKNDDNAPKNYAGNLLPTTRMPRYAFFGLSTLVNLCIEAVICSEDIDRYIRWTDERNLRFVRIWPTKPRAVSWPPARDLHTHQIEEMRHLFVNAQNPTVHIPPARRRRWDGGNE